MPGGGGFVGEHRLHVGHHGAERATRRGPPSSRSSAADSRAAARRASPSAGTSRASPSGTDACVCGEKIGIAPSSARIEAHRIRRAHSHGDRPIVEPNLAGRHAEQRAAGCVGDLRRREPHAIRLRLVDRHLHLGARLAHAVEEVLETVDLRRAWARAAWRTLSSALRSGPNILISTGRAAPARSLMTSDRICTNSTRRRGTAACDLRRARRR